MVAHQRVRKWRKAVGKQVHECPERKRQRKIVTLALSLLNIHKFNDVIPFRTLLKGTDSQISLFNWSDHDEQEYFLTDILVCELT